VRYFPCVYASPTLIASLSSVFWEAGGDKEYFPCETELALLEKQEPALFETYRELMCHFYICSDMHGNHKVASCSSKYWGDYLFPNLENTPEEAQCGVVDEDIFRRMKEHAQGDIVLEEDDGIYEKGDILRSFHHQARQPMSWKALLVGFLSVWLKRCVVPSPSSDVILPTVLLSAVRLVHGRSLGLLPAMCCIQRGLRALMEAFCRPPTTKRGKGTILPRDGPNPRIGLPYTYLMAWFTLHCPTIIQDGKKPPEGARVAHLHRFE